MWPHKSLVKTISTWVSKTKANVRANRPQSNLYGSAFITSQYILLPKDSLVKGLSNDVLHENMYICGPQKNPSLPLPKLKKNSKHVWRW